MASANTMYVSETLSGYIDTLNIGGDRFPSLPSQMFHPNAFVGSTNPVPLDLLSVPPTYANLNTAANSYGSPAISRASANPWSPRDSLVPWVIFGLALSVFAIHKMFYKGK